jgi:hypothetical protein
MPSPLLIGGMFFFLIIIIVVIVLFAMGGETKNGPSPSPSPSPSRLPCAGLTDTSLASSVSVPCLRKILTDEGCTSSGTVWPQDDYDGWWVKSPQGATTVGCDDQGTPCGAGSFATVKSDIHARATSSDPMHVAGCRGGSVKSTTADDWGEGNSLYLDRHDVDCGDDGLRQFRLGRPSATQINYSYMCKEGIDSPGTDKNSGANDWGEGNSVYLDRHNVDCGNKPIARFRLVRPADDKIQYDYRCSNKAATGSCRDVNTELNDEGEGNSVYLDRHDVKCNPDEVITQFKLNPDGQGKFRYGYKCCKM